MTLPLWHLALLLIAPFCVGVPLTRLLGIDPHRDRIGFCAWSWMLGAFATALVTFGWLAAHQPIPGPWLAPIVGGTGIAGMLVTRRFAGRLDPAAPRLRTPEDFVLLATLGLLSLWITIRLFALNVQPVLFGDEANIFAQRAKALFDADGIGPGWMRMQALLDVKHPDYPLFDPLLHTWIYAGADRITAVDNRWPIQAFTYALLFALASALRQHLRPSATAAILLLFFGMGIFDLNIGPSRAEMILSTAVLVTVDAWLRWQRSGDVAFWRLACLALAASLWAKNEAQLLLVALGCALLTGRIIGSIPAVAPWRQAAWLAAPIGLLLGHHAFNSYASVHNDLFDASAGQGFFARAWAQVDARFVEVCSFFWNELLAHPTRFGWIVPMLLLLVLTAPRRILGTAGFVPVAMVVIALIGFQIVFFATPFELAWHLPTAADRTVLHTMSVATLGLGMALATVAPSLLDESRRPGR